LSLRNGEEQKTLYAFHIRFGEEDIVCEFQVCKSRWVCMGKGNGAYI